MKKELRTYPKNKEDQVQYFPKHRDRGCFFLSSFSSPTLRLVHSIVCREQRQQSGLSSSKETKTSSTSSFFHLSSLLLCRHAGDVDDPQHDVPLSEAPDGGQPAGADHPHQFRAEDQRGHPPSARPDDAASSAAYLRLCPPGSPRHRRPWPPRSLSSGRSRPRSSPDQWKQRH